MPDILDRRRKLYRPKKKPPLVAQTAILNIISSFPQGCNFNEIVDKVLQQYHPCINQEQRVIVHNRLTPNDNNFFFTLHDTILSQSYIEKLELSTIVLRLYDGRYNLIEEWTLRNTAIRTVFCNPQYFSFHVTFEQLSYWTNNYSHFISATDPCNQVSIQEED